MFWAGHSQAARFGAVSERLRRVSLKAVIASATMSPFTQVLASCALAAVITAALWQSGRDQATVGGFVAFITALLQLIAPIKHLSESAAPITRGLAAIERGVDLLAHTLPERGGSFDPGRAQGRIELRDVSLAYRGDDAAPALDRITLTIAPGESVALVGPSGAGKSTVFQLLLRFYDPQNGTIRIDGIDIRQADPTHLRNRIALVPQEPAIFAASVTENVRYGRPEATDADVRRACDAAFATEFIERLPEGFDTYLGERGVRLSGGQRQRLAIARAVLSDRPILLLDEATSALDSESERMVQIALERLMESRTTLIIAHRLSTVKSVDRIAVIDRGRLIGAGTHEELLASNSLYARLAQLQFGGQDA